MKYETLWAKNQQKVVIFFVLGDTYIYNRSEEWKAKHLCFLTAAHIFLDKKEKFITFVP